MFEVRVNTIPEFPIPVKHYLYLDDAKKAAKEEMSTLIKQKPIAKIDIVISGESSDNRYELSFNENLKFQTLEAANEAAYLIAQAMEESLGHMLDFDFLERMFTIKACSTGVPVKPIHYTYENDAATQHPVGY